MAYLHGIGCVSAHGVGLRALAAADTLPAEPPTPRTPAQIPGRVEKLRFARLDRPCKLAVIAASDLLAAEAPAALLAAAAPEARAVVLGTAFGAHRVNEQFEAQIARDPLAGSPRLFAFTLPSTAAAQLSILLDLRGPVMTLAEGAGAGLSALAQAADLIDSGAAQLVIAGAVESVGEALAAHHRGAAARAPIADAALLCLLCEQPAGAWARVAGWAQRRARDASDTHAAAEDALRAALAEAGIARSDVRRVGEAGDQLDALRAMAGSTFAVEPLLALALADRADGDDAARTPLAAPLALSAWDAPSGRCDVLLLAPP